MIKAKTKICIFAFFLLLNSNIAFSAKIIPNELPSIKNNLGNFTFLNSYSWYPENAVFAKNLIYSDGVSDSKFEVQIIEFYDKDINSIKNENLDLWIAPKIAFSSAMLKRGKNTVFIDDKKQSIFWRSGHLFVKINFIRNYEDTRDIGDENLLPLNLLDEYLELYPSDCNDGKCEMHSEERWQEWLRKNQTTGEFNRIRNDKKTELLNDFYYQSPIFNAKRDAELSELQKIPGFIEDTNLTSKKPDKDELRDEIRSIQSIFLNKIRDYSLDLAKSMGMGQ